MKQAASSTTQAPAIKPQGKVYWCGLLRGCGYTQIVMRIWLDTPKKTSELNPIILEGYGK